MLVHRKVTPSSKFAGTHLYTWAERGTMRVKCLAQKRSVHKIILSRPGPLQSSIFLSITLPSHQLLYSCWSLSSGCKKPWSCHCHDYGAGCTQRHQGLSSYFNQMFVSIFTTDISEWLLLVIDFIVDQYLIKKHTTIASSNQTKKQAQNSLHDYYSPFGTPVNPSNNCIICALINQYFNPGSTLCCLLLVLFSL